MNILCLLFCGLVVAAPWLLGAQTPGSQVFLAWPLIGLATLQLIMSLFRTTASRSTRFPVLLVPLLALIAIGVVQLVPLGSSSPFDSIRSLGLNELELTPSQIPEIAAHPPGVHSLVPPATLVCVSQVALVVLAFWLAFQLFDEPRSRKLLLWALTLNGVAITAFAIAQKLTWNGMLFWKFPLRYGGSPFGPFSSRNNCAAYLLLCLACAISCLISAVFPFGMGRKSEAPTSIRQILQTWINRILGNTTPAVLLSLAAVLIIAVGVMVSMSRIGQIGLMISLLVLMPALSRWSTQWLLLTVVFAAGIYGGVIWLGQSSQVTQRLETLSDPLEAMQGRFDHWREVEGLIRDFPLLGCGWGCYRWANPLYLSKDPNVWFHHAENQYLEVLAEAGLLGLISFLVAFLLAAFASARAIRSDGDGTLLPMGLCGLLAATAMATNSMTNFALSMGSISLTLAVLMGAGIAAFSRSLGVSSWIHWETQRRSGKVWQIAISCGLLLMGGLASFQVTYAGSAEWDVESVPRDEGLTKMEMPALDALLSRLSRWSERYPRNPEIWAALGDLRVYRMRRAMYDEVIGLPASQKFGPRRVWENTHLERLDGLVTYSRSIGDRATEQNLLNLPSVTENAHAALNAYDRAVMLQPLNKRAALSRAWLKHFLNTPGQESARDLAMLSGVSQSDVLFQVGQISQRLAQTEVQILSWRRSLMVSGQWAHRIWDEMTLTDPEEEVLRVFPDQLDSLLAIMNLPNDLGVRRQIRQRCEAIVSNTPDVSPVLIARLHAAEGKTQVAAEDYLRAIRNSPRDIELRLEASYVLEKAQQLVKAREVVATAYGLSPRDPKVKARLEQLLTRERETR